MKWVRPVEVGENGDICDDNTLQLKVYGDDGDDDSDDELKDGERRLIDGIAIIRARNRQTIIVMVIAYSQQKYQDWKWCG